MNRTQTRPPSRWAQAGVWLLALTWACVLVVAALATGCGPGVGGTGTGNGQAALDYFGASAASVCAGELATALDCPAPGTSGQIPATAGSGALDFADSATAARVGAHIEANRILVDAPCDGLSFDGVWGVTASAPARFFGSLARTGAQDVPATATVAVVAGGLRIEVHDADGQLLLGPVTLAGMARPGNLQCR